MAKEKKPKTCKLCDKERYANTSWCAFHYQQRELEKKLKKKEREEKKAIDKAKKKTEKDLKKLIHKRVWKLMSEYIRSKDADQYGFNYCYTCGAKKHWREFHCGHYKHDRLDFDERNLKQQCYKCNVYLSGKLDVYTENLIRDYGIDWWKQLVLDSNTHQGYNIEEMLEIEKDLKDKLEVIRNK